MAIVVQSRGTGTNNVSATSFTFSPGSNFTTNPDTWAVLLVAADNNSSGGATNDFGAVTDTNNNRWTLLQSPIFDNGAVGAGVQGAIYACPTAGNLTTGTTITVNFANASTAETWVLIEMVPDTGKVLRYHQGGVTAGSTTATPSVLTGSITNGSVVVCGVFMEAGTTQGINTDDTDTTNGSWGNTGVSRYAEIGTTTAGSAIAVNWKGVTATGTQTYNLTMALSVDLIGAWAEFHQVSKQLTLTRVGR